MRNFENDTLAKFYPPLKEKFLRDSTKTKLALKLGKFSGSQLGDVAFLSSSGLVGSEESDLGFPLHPEYAIQMDANWYFLHGIFG